MRAAGAGATVMNRRCYELGMESLDEKGSLGTSLEHWWPSENGKTVIRSIDHPQSTHGRVNPSKSMW